MAETPLGMVNSSFPNKATPSTKNGMFASSAQAAMEGMSVLIPVSLFTAINEIKRVSEQIAAWTSSKEAAPFKPGDKNVDRIPLVSRYLAVENTHECSKSEVI